VTPPTFSNDLFTEATQRLQVIPETASVTVLTSAYTAVVMAVAMQQTITSFASFIA